MAESKAAEQEVALEAPVGEVAAEGTEASLAKKRFAFLTGPVIFGIAGVLLLSLSITGGYFLGKKEEIKEVSAPSKQKKKTEDLTIESPEGIFKMNIVLNVVYGSELRYLKIIMECEMENPADLEEIRIKKNIFRDKLIYYFGELRLEDINNRELLESIKWQVITATNKYLKNKIKTMYLTEISF